MSYQTTLIERAVARSNVPHRFVNGWRTRGYLPFRPQGLVVHHDASHITSGNNGALNIIIHGRHDVRGPLSQFQIARNGLLWIVCAGRANHAGRGSYRGISGNSNVIGIEAANNGIGEPWGDTQLDTYYKISRALLDEGIPWVCGHYEWTTRKVDPVFRIPRMKMPEFRQKLDEIQQEIPQLEGRALEVRSENMYKFYRAHGDTAIWAVSGGGYGFWLSPSRFKQMRGGPAMLTDVVHTVSKDLLSHLTNGKYKG